MPLLDPKNSLIDFAQMVGLPIPTYAKSVLGEFEPFRPIIPDADAKTVTLDVSKALATLDNGIKRVELVLAEEIIEEARDTRGLFDYVRSQLVSSLAASITPKVDLMRGSPDPLRRQIPCIAITVALSNAEAVTIRETILRLQQEISFLRGLLTEARNSAEQTPVQKKKPEIPTVKTNYKRRLKFLGDERTKSE